MSKNKYPKLITNKDCDDVFSGFKNDKERIKYMSQAYKNMSLVKAFSIFYGMDVPNELKSNRTINNVVTIEVGKTYSGTVKEFTKSTLTFDIPGIKDEIIAKDNFTTCMDEVNNYLLKHDNKLIFEVREHKNGKYIVSVVNAYYRLWYDRIMKAINREEGINVHIDELVKGGYICHTNISTLCELTGKNYTSSVFIPGSHIVLNIEHDFEKWIGEDVTIVPQKFVEFKKDIHTGLTENSLVGSRKRVLQILGMQNMYEIYTEAETKKKLAEISTNNVSIEPVVFDGTVTGIINSNKKTGIFVELNDKYITGLMPIDSSDLLNYKPGNSIRVKITEFEVQEGKEPFETNQKGVIKRCNVRPVFELA